MKVVKIGVMGAHGCGKSTLVQKIKADAAEAGLIPVVVDEGVRRRLDIPINYQMTIEGQRAFFQMQIEDESKAEGLVKPGLGDFVVCDRTVLDPLVYARWASSHRRDASDWISFIGARIPVALQLFGDYDRVYWCRPAADPKKRAEMLSDDGVRIFDILYQDRVDRIFKGFVARYGLTVTEVLGGEGYDYSQIHGLISGHGRMEGVAS